MAMGGINQFIMVLFNARGSSFFTDPFDAFGVSDRKFYRCACFCFQWCWLPPLGDVDQRALLGGFTAFYPLYTYAAWDDIKA